MPDFTSTLPDTHFRVSQRILKSLIESYRQEQFTGLMRLRYPSGVDLVSAFLDGAQQNLYSCLHEKMEIIPRQSWSHFMDRPDASIASLSLPVEAMRLMRVAHEAPVLCTERMNCTPEQLAGTVRIWARDEQPMLLHVQADESDRIYLIAGHSTPVIEELILTGNGGRFSISDEAFPNALSEPEYPITRYVSDNEHEAWQEYELRYAFQPFMRILPIRFGELAGRVLADRLCEKLSLQLRDKGWNVELTMNGIANHQYFGSFEEAKYTYLEILRSFIFESSQAIGSHLVNRIIHEILLKLGAHRSDLLKRHVYNRELMDNTAGRAWR